MLIAQIWPGASGTFLPAANGAWAARNGNTSSGKGGVLLLLAPWLQKHAKNSGTLPRNAGVWISLKDTGGPEIGIAAIYAPNTSALRSAIWTELSSSLDQNLRWVLSGDSNMTLHSEDQLGGSGIPMAGEERTAWNILQGSLQLRDTFTRKDGTTRFSWDNKRKVLLRDDQTATSAANRQDPTLIEGRILKRLDRVYANVDLLAKKHTAAILPGFMLSDHLLVLASLQVGNVLPEGVSKYRVNVDLLQDINLQDKINLEWAQIEAWHRSNGSSPGRTLKACIKRAVSICRFWGKLKAEKQREVINKIRMDILSLTCQLQIMPQCLNTQEELNHLQLQLQAIEIKKANWAESLLQRKWDKQGDKCSKAFFGALRARKAKTLIHELKTDQGVTLKDEDQKAAWAQAFFTNLLQRTPPNLEEVQAMESILQLCKTRISVDHRNKLEEAYTLQELHTAALELGRNKAPGPDSLPVEFFLIFWQTAGPTLLRLAEEGLQNAHLPPFFTQGDIVLLPKEGEQDLLQNKRPITLLNAGYKIIAKMLQSRLAPVLKAVVSWEQNAFMQGRNLHATVFMCNQAVWEAKTNGVDSTLLKVDFKKAFDSLSWDFLFKTMHKMGFGDKFVKCIKALTSSATSTVIVNKTRSRPVQIGRSVRQGCPISPSLFIIAMQAWTDFVNELQDRGTLAGIYLPQLGIQYIQGHYADDTHILLAAQPQNLSNAKQAISTFGKASGLNVQWSKSLATWISPSPRPPWTNDLLWKWTQDREQHKMLGFIFIDALDQNGMFRSCVQKIEKVLNDRKLTSQSLQGRVTIANHILYGYMWFIIPLWAGDGKQLDQIDQKITRFVWGGANTTPRQRINSKVLHLPKEESGLGLLAAHQQVLAFATATVSWAFTPGKMHPLKMQIRAAFSYQAEFLWGSSIEAAILNTKKASVDVGSPTMAFLLSAWAQAATLLKSPGNTSVEAWGNSPIWGPQLPAVRRNTLKGNTRGQQAIKRAGITHIRHIASQGGTLRELQDINASLEASASMAAAFNKIKTSIINYQEPPQGNCAHPTFYRGSGDADRVCIQVQMKTLPPTRQEIPLSSIRQVYTLLEEDLMVKTDTPAEPLPQGWNRVMSIPLARGKAHNKTLTLAQRHSLEEAVAHLQWQNGNGFFFSSNKYIRRERTANKRAAIDRMAKWKQITPYKEKDARRAFLVTNGWKPKLAHVLLAEPLPKKFKLAADWWEIWRGIVLWSIWKRRNEHSFRNEPFLPTTVMAISWEDMRRFTETRWLEHRASQKHSSREPTSAEQILADKKFYATWAVQSLDFRILGPALAGHLQPP
ncbi:hypothetical protein R1sor_022763 [Riccia sorocarpa]|uniref:Reverse transcriptase domain-containing protein n=1 Tax=Riccia sorocarpa TaxID=122646 RepID=A0ABD3GNR9_9MARC